MHTITVSVPDEQYAFFLELLEQLRIAPVELDDQPVPEWAKEVIRERIKTMDQDEWFDAHSVVAELREEYGK